jgi:tetratricopeptide (TPR) repeat protein
MAANNLGLAFRVNNQHAAAEKMFKKAIALEDGVAQYHFNLAVVYRTQENFEQAIPHYEQATRLDPKMSEAFWDLGVSYRANHDIENALRAFETYLVLVRGKDKQGESAAASTIEELGGKPGGSAQKKPTPKPKRKK